jgi:hypothetical protein
MVGEGAGVSTGSSVCWRVASGDKIVAVGSGKKAVGPIFSDEIDFKSSLSWFIHPVR